MERYLRAMDHGLHTLQLISMIFAFLFTAQDELVKQQVSTLLSMHKFSMQSPIKDVLQEWREVLDSVPDSDKPAGDLKFSSVLTSLLTFI